MFIWLRRKENTCKLFIYIYTTRLELQFSFLVSSSSGRRTNAYQNCVNQHESEVERKNDTIMIYCYRLGPGTRDAYHFDSYRTNRAVNRVKKSFSPSVEQVVDGWKLFPQKNLKICK